MHVALVLLGMTLGVIRYALGLTSVLLFLGSWVAGAVLAQGFGSTLFAVLAPPWGWYLIAERVLQHTGLI